MWYQFWDKFDAWAIETHCFEIFVGVVVLMLIANKIYCLGYRKAMKQVNEIAKMLEIEVITTFTEE